MAPELGAGWNSPERIHGDLKWKTVISAGAQAALRSQQGAQPRSVTRTHLEERCRTGRGLGVSFLRL